MASLCRFPLLCLSCCIVTGKANTEFDGTVEHWFYLECMVVDLVIFFPDDHFSVVYGVVDWL